MTRFEVAAVVQRAAFRLQVAFDRQARVLALQGASGSGKSTLLNVIAGLVAAEGRVAIGGATLLDSAAGLRVPPHRRQVGCVFQDGRLLPHLSVAGNLRYGRWFGGRGPDAIGEDEAVDLLGLGRLLGRRPSTLSGGERMRVAIGRALLGRPRVLLMDEPMAAVDEARRDTLMGMIEAVRDRTAIPIVYVSHNAAEVRRLADAVVTLNGGSIVDV